MGADPACSIAAPASGGRVRTPGQGPIRRRRGRAGSHPPVPRSTGMKAMATSTSAPTMIAPTAARRPAPLGSATSPSAGSEMTRGAAAAAMTAESTIEAVSARRMSAIQTMTTASPTTTRIPPAEGLDVRGPRRNEPRSAIRRGRRVSRRHRTSSVPDDRVVYRSPGHHDDVAMGPRSDQRFALAFAVVRPGSDRRPSSWRSTSVAGGPGSGSTAAGSGGTARRGPRRTPR